MMTCFQMVTIEMGFNFWEQIHNKELGGGVLQEYFLFLRLASQSYNKLIKSNSSPIILIAKCQSDLLSYLFLSYFSQFDPNGNIFLGHLEMTWAH